MIHADLVKSLNRNLATFGDINRSLIEQTDDKMQIDYVDAICGAGKTGFLVDHFIKRIRPSGSRMVIAQPTKALIEATEKRFLEAGIKPLVLHSDKTQQLFLSLYNAFNDPDEDIIIITHPGLFTHGRAMKRPENVYLFVDEIPAINGFHSVPLKYNRSIITNNIDFVPQGNGYSTLVKKTRAPDFRNVERSGKKDAMYKQIKPMFEVIANDNIEVTVSDSCVDAFQSGKADAIFYSWIVKPECLSDWNNVTIMGANFKESLLYKVWSREGVTFAPSRWTKHLPSLHTRMLGSRVSIHYVMDRKWSKRFQETDNPMPQIAPHIEELFGSEPYIYTVNNFAKKKSTDLFSRGQHVPPKSHGFNEFMDYHNAAFLAALNVDPQHSAFLKSRYGLEDEDIFASFSLEAAYQFVMRTSLRVPTCLEPVKVVVPSKALALALSDLFPGANVTKLNTEVKADVAHRKLTEAEKKAKQRETKKIIDSISFKQNDVFSFTYYRNVFDLDNTFIDTTFEGFYEAFSSAALEFYPDKMDLEMFNATKCRIRDSSEAMSNIMVFDIDGSNVPYTDLEIPYEHIIYTTFTHKDKRGEHRYRILVPINSMVDDVFYKTMGKKIVKDLKLKNVDLAKISVYTAFFLPCNGAEVVYKPGSRIDPYDFVGTYAKSITDEKYIQMRNLELEDYVPVEKIEKYRQMWVTSPKGEGNHQFWIYATRLSNIGLSEPKIEEILKMDCGLTGRSERDRKNQIPSIIKSLRNWRNR